MTKSTYSLLLLIIIIMSSCQSKDSKNIEDEIAIQVDLNKIKGPMYPAWAMVGYDEPNYTYMEDGRKLLSDISELSPVPVYVRAHNLLNTGDGTPALKWGSTNAYTEDEQGNPIYDWTLVDSIFDTYVERGIRPLVEIGFMPKALSSNPEPYQHSWKPGAAYEEIYTGWAYPPNDYEKWAELVYQWVKHCLDRYGADEVSRWYWQPWNEPNIGYWQGNTEEYLKLYDYTVHAVRRAFPKAIVGGPHSTGPSWEDAEIFLKDFLDHIVAGTNYVTGKKGSPLDFIAYHAKGRPTLQDSTILMNMGTQLRDVSIGFDIVSSYFILRNLPIIIGECDPEGCAACSMQDYPENAYRNGTMYSSYTAASFARIYELADHHDINLGGILTWAFEFEDQPWFNGYRSLATNGINKPVLNIFRMFGKMQGNRVQVTGDLAYDYKTVRDSSVRGKKADVNAMAVTSDTMTTIMLWNYHDLNEIRPATRVNMTIQGAKQNKGTLIHYRVDQETSNAYTLWKEMGSPQEVTDEQYAKLEEASKLHQLNDPETIRATSGNIDLTVDIPGQAVSLLVIKWE